MRIAGLIAAAALLSPGAAPAQHRTGGTGQRQSWEKCMDASEGITSNMMDCNGAETDYQDARLNRAYKQVMARLTPAQRIVLRNSERKWLRERGPSCIRNNEESGLGNDGTLATVIYSSCMMGAVTSRADWLENYHPR